MMAVFSVLRSRLTGTLPPPGDTGYTAGVDAFNRQRTANSRFMQP
jgi:hypothetical protein